MLFWAIGIYYYMMFRFGLFSIMERIVACIPPTLDGWVYIEHIHGPLDGPLYMGSIYSNTPPQSELPAQRCSKLDNKKANIPTAV